MSARGKQQGDQKQGLLHSGQCQPVDTIDDAARAEDECQETADEKQRRQQWMQPVVELPSSHRGRQRRDVLKRSLRTFTGSQGKRSSIFQSDKDQLDSDQQLKRWVNTVLDGNSFPKTFPARRSDREQRNPDLEKQDGSEKLFACGQAMPDQLQCQVPIMPLHPSQRQALEQTGGAIDG